MNDQPAYDRVLLELSGEMMGSPEKAIDMAALGSLVSQLRYFSVCS